MGKGQTDAARVAQWRCPWYLPIMADKFEVELTKTAYRHLGAFRRYDRNRVLDAIKDELVYGPAEETCNKKILRANPIADWELRVHPFRVFYEVHETNRKVRVVAVGVKERSKLLIAGEEVDI